MFFASTTPDITKSEIAHGALARQLAGECIVLLENDGALPMAAGGRIALFGEGARHTVKGGTGSGDVYTRTSATVEEGFIDAGFEIATTAWLDRCDAKEAAELDAYRELILREMERTKCERVMTEINNPFVKSAPPAITQEDIDKAACDTAVYVLTRNSGEGADRFDREGDYLLFPQEAENIAMLGRSFSKVIVVLNIGAVMDVTQLRAIPGISAIVMMGQLGNIGGYALCDMLTGKTMPSGRLADTWAARYADYPSSATFSHNDGDISDEPYDEGVYVGYRYFDSFGVAPAYPFGYGLGYTDFSIVTEGVSLCEDGHTVTALCKVTNTGKTHAGREVVQLYVSAPETGMDKPYQQLIAYTKTRLLNPGESQTIELRFDIAEAASFCEEKACWMLEAGSYIVRIGKNSAETVAAAELVLSECVITEQARNLPGCPKQDKLTPPARKAGEKPACSIALDAAKIPSRTVTYSGAPHDMQTEKTNVITMGDVLAGKATIEELVAQLTIEEMAELCVGTLRFSENGSLIGNASYTVPGAAGDTSAIIEKSRGVRGLILADGPAGLRLTPHFAVGADGALYQQEADMPEAAAHYYQYCTAIPIGWCLAQSWDDELLRQAGDMVGEEMEQFGVDLWLAPALNIHRNPLCGRNFEYFSEDPLISGRTAAAITQGVQRHAGKGTTIKHFCANNAEDNRYFSNSHISERALREIYLKGFEIAVKQSQPLSVMTSYNLLNGIHTPNQPGLLRDILRDEWGFEGFVMTDWFTSQDVPAFTGTSPVGYPVSSSAGCIYAGNDVQMPGCQQNVDDIIRAVRDGETVDGYRVTLAELQDCTAKLLRVAAKCMK